MSVLKLLMCFQLHGLLQTHLFIVRLKIFYLPKVFCWFHYLIDILLFFFSGKNSESKYEPVNDENNRNLFQTSSDAEILAQLEDEDEKDPDFLVNNEELNDLESTQSSPNASMSQAPPSKGKIH